MANATSTQLQELYVAYFGRAADPTGLDYWTEKGITTAKFASDMYAQAEFKDAYGSLSTESQVNQIYKNLFDREADVTGLTYWTLQVDLGNLQIAEIATHLIWAAQNNDGSADDKKALENRTNAAIAYTAEVKKTTAGILAYQAETTSPWKSGVNITEAISYLSGIDKDTVHTAAGVTTSVNTIKTNGVPTASEAFNLTASTAGDDLVGTSGNDTFTGGSAARFQNADTITGGAGTDTLNTKISGTLTATVDEVENIILDAQATSSLAGQNVGKDTTSVTVKGGYTVTYLNQVQEAFTLAEKDTGLTVTANTGFTDTATNAITVNLGAAAFGTITLGDAGVAADDGYDYETVNLVLSGDGSATLSEADNGGDATEGWGTTGDTINITGTGDFELNLADAQLGAHAIEATAVAAKIDASGHTGKLTLDLGVAELVNVKTANWTGVDVIKLNTDDDDATKLVDVASGTEVIVAGQEAVANTLTVDPNGSASGESLTVTLNNATAGSSIDLTSLVVDGFETLTINSTGTDSSSTTVANVLDAVDGTTTDTVLKITGDKKLTATGVEATWATITSTNTTGVDLTLDTGGAMNITGGSGADRIEFDTVADLTSLDSINGGDGTDTIAFSQLIGTDLSAAQIAAISNFETLEYVTVAQDLATAAAAATVDLTKISGVNELYLASALTTDANDILTVKGDSGMTYRMAAAHGGTAVGTEFILSVANAADAGTNDTVNYHSDVDGGGAAASIGAFTIDNVENLNVNISSAFETNDMQTITDVDGAQLSKITITSDAGSTSGIANTAESLTITDVETTLLANFDASTFEGALTITGLADNFIATGATIKGGTKVDTITGGTGADTITGGKGADILKGGASNDNIDGGAGADTIHGDTGVDILTGGAGNDIFAFTDDDSLQASLDTIKDFTAGAAGETFDSLDLILADDTVFKTIAKASAHDVKDHTTEIETGTVTAYITNGIISLDGTQTGEVDTLAEWMKIAEDASVNGYVDNGTTDTGSETVVFGFEFSGDTYIGYGDDGTSDGTYTTEGLVKLEGVTGITGISTTEATNVIHVL